MTLNSEGNKDVHPENHGGDFTVELHQTLDLQGDWEVALLETSYFGQVFANVLEEHAVVKVTKSPKMTFNKKFILHYHEVDDIYFKIWTFDSQKYKWVHSGTVTFEKKHYSFLDLMKAINAMEYASTYLNSTRTMNFNLSNKELKLSVSSGSRARWIELSDNLMKLLSITRKHFEFVKKIENESFTVPIVIPPNIADTSAVILTPITREPIWIKINNETLNIPNLYWTHYTLKNALDDMVKNRLPDFKISLIQDTPMDYLLRIHNDRNGDFVVELSDFLKDISFHERKTSKGYAVDIDLRKIKKDNENINAEFTFQLSHNFYPTAKLLIDNLNTLTENTMSTLFRLNNIDHYVESIFTIDNENVCSFKATENVLVEISQQLLNILQLHSTVESNTGKSAVKLPNGIRPFFHLYCDLIVPHYVNSEEEPLLRIINNTAAINDKVMQSFDYPHYYKVCRHFISNIHLYITDNLSTDPLVFINPVSHLLHFRPCHSTSH